MSLFLAIFDGKYQKKSNDFHTMNNFLQKIEKKNNLVLTGKNNPDNWINKKVDGKNKRVLIILN
jgi:hypothetical protein